MEGRNTGATFRIEDAFRVEKSDEMLLISIQPQFCELIRQGKKTVELRKRVPKHACKFAIVYESFPTKSASFLIKIKKIESAPTPVIWERYRTRCAVSKEFFESYYQGSKQSVAILIDRIIPLRQAIPREILAIHDLTPPQDYRYASKEILASIIQTASRTR
ncbi:MAG: hypothetical protein V1728_06480 [Candidatus Micrarchaeota archaeon]